MINTLFGCASLKYDAFIEIWLLSAVIVGRQSQFMNCYIMRLPLRRLLQPKRIPTSLSGFTVVASQKSIKLTTDELVAI